MTPDSYSGIGAASCGTAEQFIRSENKEKSTVDFDV
jgi:hypothetical protein